MTNIETYKINNETYIRSFNVNDTRVVIDKITKFSDSCFIMKNATGLYFITDETEYYDSRDGLLGFMLLAAVGLSVPIIVLIEDKKKKPKITNNDPDKFYEVIESKKKELILEEKSIKFLTINQSKIFGIGAFVMLIMCYYTFTSIYKLEFIESGCEVTNIKTYNITDQVYIKSYDINDEHIEFTNVVPLPKEKIKCNVVKDGNTIYYSVDDNKYDVLLNDKKGQIFGLLSVSVMMVMLIIKQISDYHRSAEIAVRCDFQV
jgi:hypothetical protein